MNWLLANPDRVRELTVEHLYLSIIPVVAGLIIALALGLVFGNRRRARNIITTAASAVFTIPSLALFVVLPSILGTQILDPVNVLVALSMYSAALLVRTVFDALDAVPAQVLSAAEAIGYSRHDAGCWWTFRWRLPRWPRACGLPRSRTFPWCRWVL